MPKRRIDARPIAAVVARLALGLVALYAVLSIGFAAVPGPRAAVPAAGATVDVFLVAGPIHYDFLLPADAATRARFGFSEPAGVPLSHPQVKWIVVGWGAQDFYTSVGTYRDVSLRAAWRGLTGDGSVMHVDVAGALPPGLDRRELALGVKQYAALLDSILAGFAHDEAGQPKALAALRHGTSDAFFEARGRFDAVRTCNAWIGQMLRAAGLRFGLWTPLPYSVSLSHWLWQTPG